MNPSISVVVNTLNEEENLANALSSVVAWVDEIVVVDMHSDDGTQEIARRFGARVVLHERTIAPDGARAFALEQATSTWVLVLDADELVPPRLADHLVEIARSSQFDAVRIPMVNYMFGRQVKFTGWGPHQDHHMRFFKRTAVQASSTIHAGFTPSATANVLHLTADRDLHLIHFNYLTVEHFLAKLNRYTTVEALQANRRGERASPGSALVAGLRTLVSRYLRRQGFRDGWHGLLLSVLMGLYTFVTHAKMIELSSVGDRTDVRRYYDRLAADEVGSGDAHSHGSTRLGPRRDVQPDAPAVDTSGTARRNDE